MAPMIIGLGKTEARVSEQGGAVTSLTDQGRTVFATQFRDPSGKLRGGCHVCAPWFGTSEFSARKHGHVRDLVGDGDSHKNIAIVEFSREANAQYPWGMEYGTRTIIHESGLVEFMAGMRRINDGNQKAAPANPAFHPYFACSDANQVSVIANYVRETGFSAKARGVPLTHDRRVVIEMPDRYIEMHLGGAFMMRRHPWIFLWTDSPREYVCVEPVLYDPQMFNTDKGVSLDIGQELSVSMTLEITLK